MIEHLSLAMSIADKVLGKLPNYEQGKREKFYKLKKEYEDEVYKKREDRDDSKCDALASDIELFLVSFLKELSE